MAGVRIRVREKKRRVVEVVFDLKRSLFFRSKRKKVNKRTNISPDNENKNNQGNKKTNKKCRPM
jgi:hypothetical protein